GGAVEDWFAVVRDVALRGVTVLLVTSKAAAQTATALLDTIPAPTTTDGPDDATATDGDDPRLQEAS
ncbi:MAG: hypothetical protein V4737_03540, partial [Curtobacterium sp.]